MIKNFLERQLSKGLFRMFMLIVAAATQIYASWIFFTTDRHVDAIFFFLQGLMTYFVIVLWEIELMIQYLLQGMGALASALLVLNDPKIQEIEKLAKKEVDNGPQS